MINHEIRKSTITLKEYCNPRRAKWLLENINDSQKITIDREIDENRKQRVIDYCKEIVSKKNGYVKRIYNNNDGFGRMFLKSNQNGFQNMIREYRSILCSNDYYDLDIKNCQPTILYQFCEKNNIKCKYLKRYVNERDEIITFIKKNINDDIKMRFISVMFGGKFNDDLLNKCDKDNKKFLINFQNEMTNILKSVSDIDKQTFEYIKLKKQFNIEGSLLSFICQDIENQIIIHTKMYLEKNKYDVSSLCFDGLLVRNTMNLSNSTLKLLNEYIYKQTGYKIEFLIKSFDKFIEIPKDELNNVDEYELVDTDVEAVKFLLTKLKKQIVKSNAKWFFQKPNTNIYLECRNDKEVKERLLDFISNYDIKLNTDKGIKEYSKMAKGALNICILLMSKIKDDDKFEKKLWTSNIHKLCFLNGYWDFKSRSFKPYDDETYTVVYVNKNYIPKEKINEKDTKFVREKILEPIIFNKDRLKYILNWWARGLAGEYTEKTWAVGLGNRDSGKSAITDLFKNTFNSYINTFNGDELLCNRIGNGDIAKKLAWIVPLKYSRLNFSNELKIEDDSGKRMKLDGTIIKSISSGGDEKKARTNYKDESEIKIQGRFTFFMNELVEIAPHDATEKLTIFDFQSIFKKELTKNEIKINETDGCKCKYFIANDDIKFDIENENIQNAFIHIILDSYTNDKLDLPECMNVKEDYDEEERDEGKILNELFEFTMKSNDVISVAEFNQIIKEYNSSMSKSKVKLILNKFGVREEQKGKKKTRSYVGVVCKN